MGCTLLAGGALRPNDPRRAPPLWTLSRCLLLLMLLLLLLLLLVLLLLLLLPRLLLLLLWLLLLLLLLRPLLLLLVLLLLQRHYVLSGAAGRGGERGQGRRGGHLLRADARAVSQATVRTPARNSTSLPARLRPSPFPPLPPRIHTWPGLRARSKLKH